MAISLPTFFNISKDQKQWIRDELRTSRFIKALWNAANKKQRQDPKFIALLLSCGWTNARDGGVGWESTRLWRNEKIAEYLQTSYESDTQLAEALVYKLPKLGQSAINFIRSKTGITHYYPSLRPDTIKYVMANAKTMAALFRQISSKHISPKVKIERAIGLLEKLSPIQAAQKKVSLLNGLTPVLACLDPNQRFPILNQRTENLLHTIGEKLGVSGALALYELIGRYGIKNVFYLDVYSNQISPPKNARKTKHPILTRSRHFRDVGQKSEDQSLADLIGKRITINKLHNRLMNKLHSYLIGRQITLKEHRFDALIENWKDGRHLLIEAKTASQDSGGRTQIRQAIGQLFDYRHTYFENQEVDLALLLPSAPSTEIQDLLKSLRIEILWFKGTNLSGSIEL